MCGQYELKLDKTHSWGKAVGHPWSKKNPLKVKKRPKLRIMLIVPTMNPYLHNVLCHVTWVDNWSYQPEIATNWMSNPGLSCSATEQIKSYHNLEFVSILLSNGIWIMHDRFVNSYIWY